MSWVLIGHVDVDSGLIAVGDPCYTTGGDASPAAADWDAYLDKLQTVGMFRSHEEKQFGQPYDHKEASVVVYTLYGDGTYPVYAEFEQGYMRQGIGRIMIDFNPSDPDEDEEQSWE